MDKPSDNLAKIIVDRLEEEGLLIKSAAKNAQAAIASGKMSAEDWQLSIELATEEETKEHAP